MGKLEFIPRVKHDDINAFEVKGAVFDKDKILKYSL